jgi:hypothetical protein
VFVFPGKQQRCRLCKMVPLEGGNLSTISGSNFDGISFDGVNTNGGGFNFGGAQDVGHTGGDVQSSPITKQERMASKRPRPIRPRFSCLITRA